MNLESHQQKASRKLQKILSHNGIAILSGEPRSGKTLSFVDAIMKSCNHPLIITKKGAYPDVKKQADTIGYTGVITTFHQVHKITEEFDGIVIDEAHRFICGYPEFSTIWKQIKPLCKNAKMIFSSGTLTPEGYAGLFPMLALSDNSPWKDLSQFNHWFEGYSVWKHKPTGKLRRYSAGYQPTGKNERELSFIESASGYGIPYKRNLNGYDVPQYDRMHETKVFNDINHLTVTITRKEAGHKYEAIDKLVQIPLNRRQERMTKLIEDQRVVETTKGMILADSGAKLLSKRHQIAGGFCRGEDDYLHEFKRKPKVDWLLKNIDPENTVVLAHYIPEQKMLAKLFPHTGSVTQKSEGVDFSHFDTLVIYSMSHSAATYEQVRVRQANIKRDKPIEVIWLISGIDELVYKAVKEKKNFTLSWYKRNGLTFV